MKTQKLLILIAITAGLAGCWEQEDKQKDERKVEQELDCKDEHNQKEPQCKHEAMTKHSTGITSNPKKW